LVFENELKDTFSEPTLVSGTPAVSSSLKKSLKTGMSTGPQYLFLKIIHLIMENLLMVDSARHHIYLRADSSTVDFPFFFFKPTVK